VQPQPPSPSPLTARGYRYFSKKDYDKAIADFTEAIAIEPSSVDCYFLRARAYMAKNDHEPAIADYTRILELAPKYIPAFKKPFRDTE